MSTTIQEIQSIEIFVGSTNPNKVQAALGAFQSLYPEFNFIAIPYDANPGIINWASQHAIGQPFGARQTAFGAINRMNDCWRQRQESHLRKDQKLFAVGLENGLVPAKAVGKQGSDWFDVCFIATRNNEPDSPIIVKRGQFIQTEFAAREQCDQEEFDRAVVDYHERIMPQIKQKGDLYLEWTKNRTDGPRTRGFFLNQCLTQALKEQSLVQSAHQIVAQCVASGMTASAGPRYQNMLWTRDMAYMAPVYLQRGYDANFLKALHNLKAAQFNKHELYNNGYETFNRFGNLPIVCIPEENRCSFLRQRIRGTMEEPSWQILLWHFCKKSCPKLLTAFPSPNKGNNKEIEALNLDSLTFSELTTYYHDLMVFHTLLAEKNAADGEQSPIPSFSLRKYIAGELENLTPGTRDSEIHFIRAIFSFVKQHPHEQVLGEFSESIAKAVFYLYMNVIDSEDGLPRGADSRDIFADILYDSKALTNAVFWYQALELLLEHAELLKKTNFLSTMVQALQEQQGIKLNKKIPQTLLDMTSADVFPKCLSRELKRLRSSIQTKLLFNENEFEPRDFIPGSRAGIALENPVNPTPIDKIIKRDNPTFVDGKTVDCQSLAQAVLTGLIDKRHYDKVIDYFKAADSAISVQVFVPISAKTDKEASLLQRVKGQVVWPHVSWSVVRALILIDTERSLNMAEEQRDKLMALGGCGEWYAIDPETSKSTRGGDSQQGWAATSMIMAIDDFYRYYSKV